MSHDNHDLISIVPNHDGRSNRNWLNHGGGAVETSGMLALQPTQSFYGKFKQSSDKGFLSCSFSFEIFVTVSNYLKQFRVYLRRKKLKLQFFRMV